MVSLWIVVYLSSFRSVNTDRFGLPVANLLSRSRRARLASNAKPCEPQWQKHICQLTDRPSQPRVSPSQVNGPLDEQRLGSANARQAPTVEILMVNKDVCVSAN